MKLSYDILWVDNETDIYEQHKSDIVKHLEDLGFLPNIIFLNDFQEYQNNDIQLDKFDLFILDYKLKNGENGNNIVKDIREEHSIYTEIIFYSAVPEAARQQIFDDKLNGVYVSSRDFDDFEDDVLNIIDVTIKKTQDVNNLRGLIMAEVAELDIIKEDIIKKASIKIPDKAVEKYTLRKVRDSGNSNKNKAERLIEDIENITFEDLFSHIGFIDSDKKVHTLGKILNKLNITEPISNEEFIEPYKSSILSVRNKFAHIKECQGIDENGKSCPVIGDIPFTQEKCIKIRQEIKKYKKLLKDLEEKIDE